MIDTLILIVASACIAALLVKTVYPTRCLTPFYCILFALTMASVAMTVANEHITRQIAQQEESSQKPKRRFTPAYERIT